MPEPCKPAPRVVQDHQLVRDALEFIVMPSVTDVTELKSLGQAALERFKPLMHSLVTQQRKLVAVGAALQELEQDRERGVAGDVATYACVAKIQAAFKATPPAEGL